MIIAWDIETCPLSRPTLTDRQKRRHDKLLARQLEQTPEMDRDDASRLVRSTNPFLGWICCISVVRYDTNRNELGTPRSYTAGLPEHEADMLAAFWDDLSKLPMCNWVTFNGKKFDVPFVVTRTLRHGLNVKRLDMIQSNPYQHRPHADLFNVFQGAGLADVCELLGVESPKQEMDGSGVQAAVKAGRLPEVAQYCERDVVATMRCFLKVRHAIV